jgi:hypothetical protein
MTTINTQLGNRLGLNEADKPQALKQGEAESQLSSFLN